MRRFFVYLMVCFLCCAPGVSFGSSKNLELIRQNAVADLAVISQVIKTKYTPLSWKEKIFGWDLEKETAKAKLNILLHPSPNVKNCQVILANYFDSLRDYHAGIEFFSTESSYLPMVLASTIDGRVFIVDLLSPISDIVVGDELVGLDGQPIQVALESILKGKGSFTDYSNAVRNLTYRTGASGSEVPRGCVNLQIKKQNDSIKNVVMQWRYTPESIVDLGKIYSQSYLKAKLQFKENPGFEEKSQSLRLDMVPFSWKFKKNWERSFRSYGLGSKSGFLPNFGLEVLWEQKTGPFRAYIFKLEDSDGVNHWGHKKLGFIRIPSYCWDEMEDSVENPWILFGKIISFMQEHTDGLIIDQQNNPGGSVFYMYSLISMLIENPVQTPLHRMTITQEEVNSSVNWLDTLKNVSTDADAREAIGSEIEGLFVDMKSARCLKDFSQKILREWEFGRYAYTNPLPLLGFDKIYPDPDYRYTKPIVLLVNEECYSCGDLMPAIMRDNGRALVVGQTTAGAGGFVYSTSFPNRTGIKSCSLTGSLAVRKDGSFIENVGVSPDTIVNFTAWDLVSRSYSDFIRTIERVSLNWVKEAGSQFSVSSDPDPAVVIE